MVPPVVPPSTGFVLTWSDEFNGTDGSAPDSAKWTYDQGGKGWGNSELECYTNRSQNVQIKGGNLVITAQQESAPFACSDGSTNNYTSARLKTQGLFNQAYGRFEARIKIPAGQGMWPAFWMLGNDITTNGWPKCGEIDIMENIGREPTLVHGSLHGPSSTATTSDENNYATFNKADWPANGTWVFDHPFFIIMNVAVGGTWPGSPDATTQFPQQMLVDYVRVYTKQ